MGLAAVEAGGGEGGDVAVAPVLPEQRTGVPQLKVGLLRPGQRPQRAEQRAAGQRRGLGRLPGQRRRLGLRRRADVVGDQAAQRDVGAAEAGGEDVVRRCQRPGVGQGPGHHGRVEVEENGGHEPRRGGADGADDRPQVDQRPCRLGHSKASDEHDVSRSQCIDRDDLEVAVSGDAFGLVREQLGERRQC